MPDRAPRPRVGASPFTEQVYPLPYSTIRRYDLSLNLLASRPDIGGEEPHAEHVAIPLQPWGRLVELSCQGKPVPPSMTLEAARRFLWKKFDSPLTLHYKILAKF